MVLGKAPSNCLWTWHRVVTYHSISHTLIKTSTSSTHLLHKHRHCYRPDSAIVPSALSPVVGIAGLHNMASLSPQEIAWPAHKVRETFMTYFKSNSHTFGRFTLLGIKSSLTKKIQFPRPASFLLMIPPCCLPMRVSENAKLILFSSGPLVCVFLLRFEQGLVFEMALSHTFLIIETNCYLRNESIQSHISRYCSPSSKMLGCQAHLVLQNRYGRST
jgi:hypothetical protein